MEALLIQLLKERGYTVAVCESLTGGMLCSALCSVPGASAAVKGGFITYTNSMKISLAGVPEEIIRKYTEVSEQTAFFMAKGCAEKCGADVGLSLTGYAGPGGENVGKVCGGIYIRGTVNTFTLFLTGSRESIRTGCAKEIIAKTCNLLQKT